VNGIEHTREHGKTTPGFNNTDAGQELRSHLWNLVALASVYSCSMRCR